MTDALRRLASDRRVVEGEFRPVRPARSGSTPRCCGACGRGRSPRCAPRSSRSRSRRSAASCPTGSTSGSRALRPGLRGIDGLVSAIDQLAGVALPASTWESLVLPSRVRDYSPAMLDELTTTGEVLWSGRGELTGGDGWLALHLADTAPLTLAEPTLTDQTELHGRVIDALAGGGAFFFRQLARRARDHRTGRRQGPRPRALGSHLGRAGEQRHPRAAARPARRHDHTARARPRRAVRCAAAAGHPPPARWQPVSPRQRRRRSPDAGACCPRPRSSPTVRATALAEQLLERHGIVTRGAVMSEGVVGGFPTAYKVLSGLEETGRTRRGYFIEGLGAAQFATPATVDRLARIRRPTARPRPTSQTALRSRSPSPQPTPRTRSAPRSAGPPTAEERHGGHRPGRKAGALVVLVDGALGLFVERGGKTVLNFTDDQQQRDAAAASLAATIRATGGRLRIEKIDGAVRDRHPARRCPHGIRIRAHAAGPAAAGLGAAVPEGDTVYKTAMLQNAALAGATLTGFDLRVPKFATSDLTGETVHERRVARQAPAAPHRRLHAAHAPQDGGRLAHLRAR